MNPHSPLRLARLCLMLSIILPSLRAAENAPAAGPEKTHVLFMGADLAVQRNKTYHRVEDVKGSELKYTVGKREYLVPTRQGMTDLKISHGLKLAHTSVTLDGFQSGPAYTTANDPARKFAAASGSAGGAAAMQDLAQGQVAIVSTAADHAERVAAANAGIPEAQQAAAEYKIHLAEAERNAANLSHMSNYDSLNSAAAQADRMQGEAAESNYDAMEVSFKVSSALELDDPYMVVLFKFRERDAKPGEEGLLVHVKSLDAIGPKPKYVRVREGGLPRGFQYLDCTVHIYNRGEEVATNTSPKRVELTRDEAKQYLVIEHLGANKGATVPAIPVPGTLPAIRRQALSLEQLNRLCFAKVAEDGSLLGAYLDESCNQPLEDSAALAALKETFFKPALKNGKPVEGVARLTLGSI